jgi:hypothetical protein
MREAGAVEEICFGDFGTEKWLNCRAGGVEKDANGRGGRRRAAADKRYQRSGGWGAAGESGGRILGEVWIRSAVAGKPLQPESGS